MNKNRTACLACILCFFRSGVEKQKVRLRCGLKWLLRRSVVENGWEYWLLSWAINLCKKFCGSMK